MYNITLMKPTSLHGMLIASGRCNWIYDEDMKAEGFYDFDEPNGFKWFIGPKLLEKWSVNDDDVLDCILQAEEMLGSPENYRTKIGRKDGLNPGEGWTNVGIELTSRTNEKVKCIFTPVSDEYTNLSAFFEWYYDTNMSIEDMEAYLKAYQKMSGPSLSPVKESIDVPTYEEAAERLTQLVNENKLNAAFKEQFLESVWSYAHNQNKIYKEELRNKLCEEWKQIQEMEDAELANSKFGRGSPIATFLEDLGYQISEIVSTSPESVIYMLVPPLRWSEMDMQNTQESVMDILGDRFGIKFGKSGTSMELVDLGDSSIFNVEEAKHSKKKVLEKKNEK